MHLARVPRGYAHKWRKGRTPSIVTLGTVNSESVERQHNLEEK